MASLSSLSSRCNQEATSEQFVESSPCSCKNAIPFFGSLPKSWIPASQTSLRCLRRARCSGAEGSRVSEVGFDETVVIDAVLSSPKNTTVLLFV